MCDSYTQENIDDGPIKTTKHEMETQLFTLKLQHTIDKNDNETNEMIVVV